MRRTILAVVVLSACAPEVDSPGPQLSGIKPNLVCSAQITKPVVISGSNLTPLPTKTLGTEVIVLPQVSLTETQTLTGMPASGMPIVIADDPMNPSASHVRWESEQQMTFDFTPDVNAMPGLYDVTVTNPDGKKASLPTALAVVPPPSISMVTPMGLCDAESDQTITIRGTSFLTVDGKGPTVDILDSSGNVVYTTMATASDCTPVAGTRMPALQLCMTLTITIPRGTLQPGTYTIRVTNPADAECHSTESITLKVEPPPIVDSVMPSTICAGGGQLTINGSNFLPEPTVQLQATGQATVTGTGSNLNAAGTSFTATIGPGAVPGVQYDVVVTNPDGCTDVPPHKKVTAVVGPIAYLADPQVVYNGVNTRVTIYTTGLTLPLPANAVTIVPTGQSSPVTTLAYNTVAGHPNRLQVIIPVGQAPGVYDLYVHDSSGCPAILPMAITVTQDLTVTIKQVLPPFGSTASDTAVTIFRDTSAPAPGDHPFVATPRAFLNPHNPAATDIAIPLESVAFVDANTLTAVVPANQPPHVYDLIVANPDGTIGFLANAFTVTTATSPPPTITSVTPSSIVDATGQVVNVVGQNFRGSTITLSCKDPTTGAISMPPVVSGTVNCSGIQCSQSATIDGSALAIGSVCVLRLTNGDGTYADYSAIGVTNPSLNLPSPHAGTNMNVGRRALVSSAGDATSAARFVYAIGGDNGAPAGALDSTEFAPVDPFGVMGAWTVQKYTLPGHRTLAASAKMGRYTYVFGGTDGATPANTAWRAMILDPREVPGLDVDDLVLANTGLDAGYWFYRVSATYATSDLDNPGGESLASDEFILRLPAFSGKKIQVVLVWTSPKDSLGNALPNVTGYRIYRTPVANGMSGGEVLIATVNGSTLTYTDDGSATPMTDKPLPLGSMGNWASLPNLGTARVGAAGAAAFDPGNPQRFYVYALLGESSSTTVLTSYEYLPVTIQANGHQVVGTSWTSGAQQSAQGRWQLGAWTADSTVSSTISAGSTYVYLGGGLTANNMNAGKVEAGLVAAGGDLGALSDTPRDFTVEEAGYGVCAANNQLFAFGGVAAMPFAGAKSATLIAPPPTLAVNSWNDEGITLTHGRYLMGSTVQNAFIFLVGGQTNEPSPASTTTELVIW